MLEKIMQIDDFQFDKKKKLLINKLFAYKLNTFDGKKNICSLGLLNNYKVIWIANINRSLEFFSRKINFSLPLYSITHID